jgi:CheY-like chemotaxis protein
VDLPQKLAFVVQPNRLQGLIWQAILKSQKFSVILESANADLGDCLSQIATAGLTLPDLIILDADTPDLNPYEFCRWCQARFPMIQVFLTRVHNQPLSDTERRWATKQGAADFFNGFSRETLMSTAATNIKSILAATDEPFLDEKALLTVLLNIRRQIGTTKAAASSKPQSAPVGSAKASVKAASAPAAAVPPKAPSTGGETTGNFLRDLDWVTAGLQSLKHNQTAAQGDGKGGSGEEPTTAATANLAERQKTPTGPRSTPTRRYRGVAY